MQCEYCDSVLTAIPADRTCPHCGGRLPVQQAAPSRPASRPAPTVNGNIHTGSDSLRCPHCFSTGITAKKRGFSILLGIVGFFLIPYIGVFLGFIGSGKTVYTCPSCHRRWKV